MRLYACMFAIFSASDATGSPMAEALKTSGTTVYFMHKYAQGLEKTGPPLPCRFLLIFLKMPKRITAGKLTGVRLNMRR